MLDDIRSCDHRPVGRDHGSDRGRRGRAAGLSPQSTDAFTTASGAVGATAALVLAPLAYFAELRRERQAYFATLNDWYASHGLNNPSENDVIKAGLAAQEHAVKAEAKGPLPLYRWSGEE